MKKSGLTLIEVCLTVFLASLISLAVYAVLANGIRIWQDVQAKQPVEDAAFFFEKFSEELKSSFRHSSVSFQGNVSQISIPAIVKDPLQYGPSGQGVGEVRYVFDGSASRLQKAQATYSDLFEGRPLRFSSVLTGITDFSLSYYFFDKEKKEHLWSPDWPPQDASPEDADLPLAVGLSMTLSDGAKTWDYNEAVFLFPSGQ